MIARPKKGGGSGGRGLRPPSRVRAIDSPSMCAGLHQYAPASPKLGGVYQVCFDPKKTPKKKSVGRLMGDLRGHKQVAQPRK